MFAFFTPRQKRFFTFLSMKLQVTRSPQGPFSFFAGSSSVFLDLERFLFRNNQLFHVLERDYSRISSEDGLEKVKFYLQKAMETFTNFHSYFGHLYDGNLGLISQIFDFIQKTYGRNVPGIYQEIRGFEEKFNLISSSNNLIYEVERIFQYLHEEFPQIDQWPSGSMMYDGNNDQIPLQEKLELISNHVQKLSLKNQ
ncbi:hypothetical protein PGT21_011438 [Puccinia graminis f. sp. tritici]|uniref:Uncharacterized protein n=2 Tax=Puccinia graminis f. sp. tritici TaxID=56615 RepID=A0A5B0M6U0_PUCGR|nr:hypothetical protein PGT21_011438 [Puccinia graminis f. sp. tritici]